MSNTTICYYFFQVNHTQCSQTPINNTNLTNSRSQRSQICTPFRKHIQVKTLLSVSSLFKQNPPQLYASCGTPFYVCFRQPQMQRHQRYFYCKRLEKAPPQNINKRGFQSSLCLKHIGSCSPPTLLQQYTGQHCQTSNQSVKNLQISRTYFTCSTSPKSNLLEHRQLRAFVQYIKTQSVQPCKSPKKETFQCLLQCIERLPVHILGIPTTLHRQRHQCCSKQYHPKTQTVQSKFQLNTQYTIPIPTKPNHMLEGKHCCWNKSSPLTHTQHQSLQTKNLCKKTMFFAFFSRDKTLLHCSCQRKQLHSQLLSFYWNVQCNCCSQNTHTLYLRPHSKTAEFPCHKNHECGSCGKE